MARNRQQELLKAKQRKQKIFVAVGAAGLLAAGAFEIPMLMNAGKSPASEAAPPAATAPAAAPATLAPPAPGAAAAPAPAAAPGELVDTDVPPQPSPDRLVGFGLFRSKDPFVQQVSDDNAAPASEAPPVKVSTPTKADTPAADVPSSSSGGAIPPRDTVVGPPGGGASAGTAKPAAATVTISVNGKQESVGKGGTFPQAAPVFRLVALGNGTAEIGIVGGTYASGSETIALKQGVPLTLVNTTDDTRYRLVLVETP